MDLRERERTHNGGHVPLRQQQQALGDVARDAIDHVTMIGRDVFKIGKLEARRYAEHLRYDVAPKAAFKGVAAAAGGLGVTLLLIGIFIGIASAIGVGWTFVLYGAIFLVGAAVAYSLGRRGVPRDEGEEIARRFPAARMIEGRPEHQLAAQRTNGHAHLAEVEEARREAAREVVIKAEDQRSR